jgi:hypothetical protein
VVHRNGAEGAFPVLPVVVLLVHGRHLLRIKEEGISWAGNGVSRGAMAWGSRTAVHGETLTLESLGRPEAGHRRPRTSNDGHGRCIAGDDGAAWFWTASRRVSLYVLVELQLGGGGMLWCEEAVSGEERGAAMREPSTPAGEQRRPGSVHRRRRQSRVVLDAEPAGEPLWPGQIAAKGSCVLWRGEAVSGDERRTAMRRPSMAADGQRRPGSLHRRRRSRVILDAFRSWPDRGWRRRSAGIGWGGGRRGWGEIEWGMRSVERRVGRINS